jgi:hypothetical protein
MLLQYLCSIPKIFSSISNFVFFDICVSLSGPALAAVAPTRYWTQIAVCTLHCESIIARGSFAARAALSSSSGGPEAALGGALSHRPHRPQQRQHRSRWSALGPAEYVCWSERTRSGARTSRVRQAEPGSRVAVAVTVGKVPVAAYCEPHQWSEQWEPPEFAWRRRLNFARYAQPSTERRSV